MGGIGRLSGLLSSAKTTPGILRVLLAAIVGLAGLLGVVGGLAQGQAASGTYAVMNTSEPLVADAVAIYSSIADANTVAAQAFLSGGLEPASQVARYDRDITAVARLLSASATRVSPESGSAKALVTLSEQLPVYTGLIQAARANNRQGLPVGSAYLSEADKIARNIMLPAADQLLAEEQRALDRDYASAKARPLLLLMIVLIVALAAVLGAVQVFLSRRTRRTFNIGLVASTASLVVLVLIVAVVAILQTVRLNEARSEGTDPLVRSAHARIAALVQHSDDSLLLVSRRSGAALEMDFEASVAKLLGTAENPGLLEDGSAAESAELAYVQTHHELMALIDKGDYNGAVALATSTDPTGGAGAFAKLDAAIAADVAQAEKRFSDSIANTRSLQSVAAALVPLLCVAIAVFAVLGIRRRLGEYR